MDPSKARQQCVLDNCTIFFWQNIMCRYGVPQQITVDNAKYFDSGMFKDFCHQDGTKVSFASVYHAQSNGVVE
jgi:hypothetical protein